MKKNLPLKTPILWNPISTCPAATVILVFPLIPGVEHSETLASFSFPSSLLNPCPGGVAQAVTQKPTEELYKDSFTLPPVPHLAGTRTALSLAPKAVRGEHLATQCWNQQRISVSWSHLHTHEGFLFSQQPWEVTPHRCWD